MATDSADEGLDQPKPFALVAVGAGLVGAILVAVSPALEVAQSARGGEPTPIGTAAVIAAISALVPPVLAAIALFRKQWEWVGGLLGGAGAISVGLVVLDVHLFRDEINANRFELFRPETAAALAPGLGAYCVLAGHLLSVVAGVLGLVLLARAAMLDGYGQSADPEVSGRSVATRAGAAWTALIVLVAAGVVVLLFPTAWNSTDPVIVAGPAIEAGWIALAAAVALAAAILTVAGAALASGSIKAAAGAVIGASYSLFGLVGVRWVAGVTDERLDPTAATTTAAIAAIVLVIAGSALPPLIGVRERRAGDQSAGATRRSGVFAGTPSAGWWHAIAGSAGIVTALLVGVGAVAPILSVPAGQAEPEVFATRVALVSAVVLLIASVWLLMSEFATAVRPAVGVLCGAVVMVGAGVLQATVEGQRVSEVGVGAGSILIGLGVLAATVTGLLVWVAGSAERDDIDMSDEPEIDRSLLAVGSVAAAVSVIALGSPLYRGSDASATSFAVPWGWDSWGQALFGLVVAATVLVAVRSRPARASALLAGSAVGMGVYLAGWPLTVGRVGDGSVDFGVPITAVALLLLASTAFLAVRR